MLSGGAVARIAGSKLKSMVVTDSIAATEEMRKCPNIRRISIAPLIGEAMRRINNEESVSSLFDSRPPLDQDAVLPFGLGHQLRFGTYCSPGLASTSIASGSSPCGPLPRHARPERHNQIRSRKSTPPQTPAGRQDR